MVKNTGIVRFEDTGMEIGKDVHERYGWTAEDFASVRGETEWVTTFARGDWSVRIETRQVLTSTSTDFRLHATLDAFEGQTRVCSRNWDPTVQRDLL